MANKHPLQMILEASGVAYEAYTGPLNARLPGIGVPLEGLDKVGALVVAIMEEVAANHSPDEAEMRADVRAAVSKMGIDVYPRVIVVWFPVAHAK